MRLPQGRLRKSRVVTDPREPLAEVLDRTVTGYAVFEAQDSLLLDADGRGVVTFEDGVPVVAYHTGTDRGGPPALADSTRRAAPGERPTVPGADGEGDHSAVEAFLEDEDKIAAIREQARQEARQRAAEWGLNDT